MSFIILPLIILFLVLGIFVIISSFVTGGGIYKEKPKYLYNRKQFFMTRAEHGFYKTLLEAVGDRYFIFAQVHLPTLLDHKVHGQNWHAAFAHINRKSVDFVLCDKDYISPKLAIELDDSSHERPDRQERDRIVENILENAGVPLLRVKNNLNISPQDLAEKITKMIG